MTKPANIGKLKKDLTAAKAQIKTLKAKAEKAKKEAFEKGRAAARKECCVRCSAREAAVKKAVAAFEKAWAKKSKKPATRKASVKRVVRKSTKKTVPKRRGRPAKR